MNARDQARALKNGSDGTMKGSGYQGKIEKKLQPLTSSHKTTFHFTSARLHLRDTVDQNISCFIDSIREHI